jgi:hypothetical protein
MHLRQYICGVVVALCATNGVLGQDAAPRSRQTPDDVATIENIGDSIAPSDAARDDELITSYQHTTGLRSATDNLQDTVVVPDSKSEGDWISSSESVPTISQQELDASSPHTALFVRQDNDESIPTQDPNALPIEPKITPAIGIAGAIMLGTGVALCLVGVKKSWLHIFLSTGYLASLAVTVLIIYVMNPEHSNAIQGAYMVAAVVTGLIFGAVSLVFQEVTEGLGCMLGSFCFAMWILVLAPGGTIHSTAGRGILIGVITVAGFGLSLTHYTRMYALLCCTSFAGATITILGVDCFSRAGLKEFWLFLWKLNPKQFPLETNTYPITRGIRVEIACIVVVFLLGLVSQFKLWKVIKARREKSEEERKRVENEHIEAEAAIGRDIEANTQRERADWEAAYGEKNATKVQADSCAGSSMETSSKHQYSVREREVDGIELSDIEEVRSGRFSNGEKGTVHEGHLASGESQEALVEMGENSRRPSNDSIDTDILDGEGNVLEQDSTHRAYAPGAPEVVPLPFRVPTDEEEQDHEAVAPSEASKRRTDAAPAESVVMPLQKLSLMQLNEQYASDGDRRADQASSVAATADDVAVLGDLTPGQSRVQSMLLHDVSGDRLAPPTFAHDQSKRSSVVSYRELEQALDEDDEEALPRDPVVIDVTPAPIVRDTSTGSKSNQNPTDVTVNVLGADGSSEGHPGSVSEGIIEQLPAKLSKIALTYRTNEWAKHIADADHPDNAGEMERPSSPGVQVETNFPEEVAKPVDVEELQKTNSSFDPNMPAHSSSKASKKSQRPKRQSQPVNDLNRMSSTTQSPTPIYSFSRSSSQASLNRQQSTSGSPARPKLGSKRQSSMQLTSQPLVESPVEDANETFQPSEFAPTTDVYPNAMASTSASNLLDERNQMLSRRPTTVSFNGFRSTPTLGMMSGAIPEDQELKQTEMKTPIMDYGSPTFSTPNRVSEDENMTLSQRRSLMQLHNNNNIQNSPTPTSPGTPTKTPGSHKNRPSIYSTLAYDSHQPARQSSTTSVQQSARLNQWRQTLQADVQAKQPPRVVESTARQNMMDGRRQSELRHARKKEEEGRRQSAIDEAMRRGQLDGAHRDAMRRMQAKANKEEKE